MSARRVEVEIGSLVVDDPRLVREDIGRAVGREITRLLAGDEARAPAGERRVAVVRTQIPGPGDLNAAGVGRAVAAAAFEVLHR